jgi:hypothetical protein
MKKIITAFIFCFLCGECFPQAGEWVWVHGDSTIYSRGHFGTQGIPSVLSSPPSLYEPCEWKDLNGNFWMFGGFHSSGSVDTLNGNWNALWKYNPLTDEWTWIKGASRGEDYGYYGIQGIPSPFNNPPSRAWGTPTWVDNNGNLWLYGGSIQSDDLWKYNISTNEWTWMKGDSSIIPNFQYVPPVYGTYQVPDVNNTPGSRQEVNTTWTDISGNLWLFGGGAGDWDSTYEYNDLWKFDISLNQWVWMKGPNYHNDSLGNYGIMGIESPSNLPPARSAYAKWKDPQGNFYFFGGWFISDTWNCQWRGFNDVWKYNITTNNWIWLGGDTIWYSPGYYSSVCMTNSNNIPRNSNENRATSYDSSGNVYMFGSIGCLCDNFTAVRNEIWQYNICTNQWTLIKHNNPINWGIKGISNNSNAPPKKFGSISWLRGNEFWVFGGSRYGNSESFNDLWKFTIDTSCFSFCSTTDIQENNFTNELLVFPNPTNSSFTISFSSSEKQTVELRIYNTLGKQIYVEKSTITKGKFEKEIHVEKWSDGIYFLQVKMNEGMVSKKVVVQH